MGTRCEFKRTRLLKIMKPNEIQRWAQTYIEAQSREITNTEDPLWWAIDLFFELMESKPEACWEVLVEISRRNPPEGVIRIAGAGPLEDLIDSHGNRFIDQIEVEAERNLVFRKMLDAVWESSDNTTWSRIMEIRSQK
ncbi:hypothetical protein LL916_14140 [Xanthomonas oryzae]|uniref:DUF6869 domain-containing protein n=2 Tax=Xanthomonas oryzae TaxID=347 RepID=UPI001F046B4C|nr:hypothetical protein [Xanthomonas oryzae]WDN29017.1 hypothetical protein LL916_14140 [Xanthomonas oryzae]